MMARAVRTGNAVSLGLIVGLPAVDGWGPARISAAKRCKIETHSRKAKRECDVGQRWRAACGTCLRFISPEICFHFTKRSETSGQQCKTRDDTPCSISFCSSSLQLIVKIFHRLVDGIYLSVRPPRHTQLPTQSLDHLSLKDNASIAVTYMRNHPQSAAIRKMSMVERSNHATVLECREVENQDRHVIIHRT